MVSYTTKTTEKKKKVWPLPPKIDKPIIPTPIPKKEPDIPKTTAPTTAAPSPSKDYTPKMIRDQDTGKIVGVDLPDGRVITGISPGQALSLASGYLKQTTAPSGTKFADEKDALALSQKQQIQAEIDRANLKKQMISEQTVPRVSPEFLSSLSELTPEQQAIAGGSAELSGKPGISQILTAAGERAAIGAAGGATGGALIGALGGPTAPLTVPAAALLGLIGGAVTGAVTGTFAAINEKDKYNLDLVDLNFEKAKYNINQAVTQAIKGGDPVKIKTEWGNSLAAIDLVERQYKELSQDPTKFKLDIRLGMTKLEIYRRDTLPDLEERLIIALRNPNANIIDYGLDDEGNPVGE